MSRASHAREVEMPTTYNNEGRMNVKLDDSGMWVRADAYRALAIEHAKLKASWSESAPSGEAVELLRDLLDFARRRLPTGGLPPQGARAIKFFAKKGDNEYLALYEEHREAIDRAADVRAERDGG